MKNGIEDILNAYRCGLFPMADHRDSDRFYWYDPPQRGQLSIHNLHVPKKLKKTILQRPYTITINQDFEGVINACAALTNDRPETWINQGIRNLFLALHRAGYAHSIECYDRKHALIGGLYGLAIGGAFMGESMFSRAPNASKIALVALCAQLDRQGFQILDTQFVNDHLTQFGVYEIPRESYLAHLQKAALQPCSFAPETQNTLNFEIIKQYVERK